MKRFRVWSNLPVRMLDFAARTGREDEWRDTLELVRAHLKTPKVHAGSARVDTREPGVREDRPVFGRPIRVPGMCFAPTNEQGVVGLFMALAHRLGFEVKRLQTAFPDCLALRKVAGDQWQDCIIEFEEESREFLKHGHDAKKCDLIVCWRHNWEECPVEVLCLEEVVRKMFATDEH